MVDKKIFLNPFVVSALICAVLCYAKLNSVRNNAERFSCVFAQKNIFVLRGTVASSSQKSNDRYAFNLDVSSALAHSDNSLDDICFSDCYGRVRVYLPASEVEAFFPGRLYSAAKYQSKENRLFCETGANVSLRGKFFNGKFYADGGRTDGWNGMFSGRVALARALSRLEFRRLMYAWGDAGGFLLSLFSGARDYTEKNVADGFRDAGLSHIIALSGMHLSLVSAIVFFLGIKCSRRLAIVLQALAILLFVWFAGASPSLVRAFLCSSFMLVAMSVGASSVQMIYVLAFAFLAHAIILPDDLCSVAFMLSYGALLGIITVGALLAKHFAKVMPHALATSFSSSVAAQVFTAPISLTVFGTFAPIGIIATVVVSPLITLFVYAGFAGIFLCMVCPPLVSIVGFVLNVIYFLIKNIVLVFAQFPVVQV